MKDVARMMKVHLYRILNYFTHRITNARTEGINSKKALNTEDGIWIQEQGAPEDCNILQAREFTALPMNPHKSPMDQINYQNYP